MVDDDNRNVSPVSLRSHASWMMDRQTFTTKNNLKTEHHSSRFAVTAVKLSPLCQRLLVHTTDSISTSIP
jgi:hypothetical protein